MKKRLGVSSRFQYAWRHYLGLPNPSSNEFPQIHRKISAAYSGGSGWIMEGL